MAKIYLDYGHGGSDPGASGSGLVEKVLTLQIGTKVSKILRNHGVIVSESRTTDKYLSLTERANLANKNGVDVFASIHINDFDKESANGVETFSHIGSSKGARIAKMVQDELVATGLFKSNRGTKTANFTVLAKTKAPAILTELGFIKNAHDSKVLKNNQNELAIAVAKGLLRAVNTKYKEEVKKPSTSNSDRDLFYRVVTGSFNNKENAEERIDLLKKAGFESFIDIYKK